MGFTGSAYTLCGRLAEGMPVLEQAVERTVAEGRKVNEALWVTRVGEAALLAGRLEAAHTHAVQALTLARERQERGHQAYARRRLGEIAARHSPAQGMRPLQAHCHRGLGILYAATGQREQVRAEISAAVDLYHAMEMTLWLPEAEVALAQVEGR